MGAAVLAALGVGSGAKARIKAARLVATSEVWREEAEAQKARGDRLEAAVHELTEQVGSLRADVRRLTGVLRMVAPELIKGEVDDDD
jgi:F0F1-type ATP synthase membrane subunit b/b'